MFDDGSQGEVDFREVDFREDDFRGVFEPLRDPAYFAKVAVDQELGTIVWPNDALRRLAQLTHPARLIDAASTGDRPPAIRRSAP